MCILTRREHILLLRVSEFELTDIVSATTTIQAMTVSPATFHDTSWRWKPWLLVRGMLGCLFDLVKHSWNPEEKAQEVFSRLVQIHWSLIRALSQNACKRQEHDRTPRNWAQMFRPASQKYFVNLIWQHNIISRWCYSCATSEHAGGQNKLSLEKFPKYTGNKKSCPDFWCIIQLQPDNGLGAFQQRVVNFGKTRTQLGLSAHPAERLLSVGRQWEWICPGLQRICLAPSPPCAQTWPVFSQSQSNH